MASLSSGRDVCRSRAGSSRCDFVGVEPRTGSRRSSHILNSPVQHLIDAWQERPCPTMNIEKLPPHILAPGSSSLVPYIEIGGSGDKQLVSIILPWMHVAIRIGNEVTLEQMKAAIFTNIKRMAHPQYSISAEDYVFRVVTITGSSDLPELTDLFFEEQMLCKVEMTPSYPVFFLYEPEGFRNEKDIAKAIGNALGYPLTQLESQLGEELRDCRIRLFNEVELAVGARGQGGVEHYAFPEDDLTTEDTECPNSLLTKISSHSLAYHVYYRSLEAEKNNDNTKAKQIVIDFKDGLRPKTLIETVLGKLREVTEPSDTFLLQVAGQKCYLSQDDQLLINYGSVRSALEDYRSPQFVLRRKEIVFLDYPPVQKLHKPSYVRAGVAAAAANEDTAVVSLWDLDANLTLRPISCSNMGSTDIEALICVHFGVFAGRTLLYKQKSSGVPIHNPRWQGDFMEFDIYMKDLPPSAILSISLVEEKPSRKKPGTIEERALSWVNVPLFDWRNELLQGLHTFSLRTDPVKGPDFFNPEGKLGNSDAKGASRLMIEMAHWQRRVRLPAYESYAAFVDAQIKWGKIMLPPDVQNPERVRHEIEQILRKHLTGDGTSKEEEDFIWKYRHFLATEVPDALLILCECDEMWKTRDHYGEVFALLGEWSQMSHGASLLLLGKKYLDSTIRRFAVEHLDAALNDQTFHLFILPLVQALKCGTYACSALALLLVRKALSDYRIGHKLFWILRAELADLKHEMDLTKGDGRFSEEFKLLSLILEAYLRGNEDHIRMITRQVVMVERLTQLSVVLKSYAKDVATKKLREELRRNLSHFEHLDSPLDPRDQLGQLDINRCKVLGSAKMPLRLCWKNSSPMAGGFQENYEIIFKNGDDLRQDMLVLQVLEIMDAIWKRSDLDCCLSPYPVLPMGTKIGMIGVVQDCVTFFEIQSEGGKVGTAVKSLETTFINKYIRNHATATKDYLMRVDRFLTSCVGYSVATYIMGIKDRHNDNIMMTHSGKLFHIDFGHILGHGKTKLGIQRDRVPFVLTEHFLCVIAKGKNVQKESHDVDKFRQLCVEAYLYLWDFRNLFVSLFTVMQGMQLPELSTQADLEYLKRALCVGGHDRRDAEKHFLEVFDEAFNGSWSTKTNWFFHTVKHL
ncbi:unnamed protein product, partial [Mesorhabditis belari]|uniref:Phosphatidylinositol 3-kinase n=1 Tax=Mesorhabditis belari TaxID=2138241 RepID=A0AAF3FFV1_9BILA